jgi:hypothetical protein
MIAEAYMSLRSKPVGFHLGLTTYIHYSYTKINLDAIVKELKLVQTKQSCD